MRRAPGLELGVAVLEKIRRGEDFLPLVKRAGSFLAWYHAWHGVQRYASSANALIHVAADALRAVTRQFRISKPIADELHRQLRELVDVARPLVAKKDAHAENWIVTPDSQIVMIDLEAKASTRLPLLYELAQLIEDQGLLSCDDDGWRHREEVIGEYLGEIRRLVRVSKYSIVESSVEYALFALIRAVANLPAVSRRHISRTSESSVVRAREHRANHYHELIRSIRDRFPDQAVGELARLIGEEVHRHEETLRPVAAQPDEEALLQPSLPITS
jgi:hypothetical protein